MKPLLLALLLVTSCRKAPQGIPAIEAYVWQNPDRPAVTAAVQEARGQVATFHVRAAEFRWDGKAFTVDQAVKNQLPFPNCGLVVRIGASASRLEWTPQQTEAVAAVIRGLASLQPKEIQCDYDCPQKRLDRYGVLLDALQLAAGEIPVTPTVLPSWMGEPAFKNLIAKRPGYVLQVHSLGLPKSPDDPVRLFDPVASRAYIKQASALGVPFRVAMATYGCEVWFDGEGRVIEVISEDRPATGNVPARRSYALADPLESARLIEEWNREPPAGLQAVIWYRLPIKGDQRNWPWSTLQQVASGQVTASATTLEAVMQHETRDLSVINHGAFPAALPAEIVVTSTVIAADGSGAYRLERRADGLHFIRRAEVWPWLDPGEKIPTGWLRTAVNPSRMDWFFAP
jgi:Protein of unknown function (DUF3142)